MNAFAQTKIGKMSFSGVSNLGQSSSSIPINLRCYATHKRCSLLQRYFSIDICVSKDTGSIEKKLFRHFTTDT